MTPWPTERARLTPMRRLYLEAHEIVCRRIDAWAMAQARVLPACADEFAGAALPTLETVEEAATAEGLGA